MNAPASATPAAGPRLQAMQCLVKGRIEHSSFFDGRNTTRIVTPAPDPYSRPQFVAIRSKTRLGQVGDEVTVICQVGGYVRKPFQVKDKETGEIVRVTPVDMTLDALE